MTTRWLVLPAAAVLMCLLVPSSASAQGKGVLVGLNEAKLTAKAEGISIDLDRRAGLLAGVFVDRPIRRSLGVEIEALLSMKGSSFSSQALSSQGDTLRIRVTYLDIPVLGRYEVALSGRTKLHLLAGPSVNVKVHSDVSFNGISDDLVNSEFDKSLKGTEVAFVAGADIVAGRFRAGIRNSSGVSNIAASQQTDIVSGTLKSDVLSLTAGVGW